MNLVDNILSEDWDDYRRSNFYQQEQEFKDFCSSLIKILRYRLPSYILHGRSTNANFHIDTTNGVYTIGYDWSVRWRATKFTRYDNWVSILMPSSHIHVKDIADAIAKDIPKRISPIRPGYELSR